MNALYSLFLDREDDETYDKMCSLLAVNNDFSMSVLVAKQAAKTSVHLKTFCTLLHALNLKQRHYLDLLFWGCSSTDESLGHLEIVEWLIGKLQQDLTEKELSECLWACVEVSNVRLCNLFLRKGANVDFKNEAGESLLHAAVQHSSNEVVILLLDNGANIDVVSPIKRLDVLSMSCLEFRPCLVEYLLGRYPHLRDRAPDCYDLLGCRALTFNVDDERALVFWRKALALRGEAGLNEMDRVERIREMFIKVCRIRGIEYVLDSEILFHVFKGLRLNFEEKISVLRFLVENYLCDTRLTGSFREQGKVDLIDTHLHTFCIVLCHYPHSIRPCDLLFFLTSLTNHVEQVGVVTNYVIDCFIYLINGILKAGTGMIELRRLVRRIRDLELKNEDGDTLLHCLSNGAALRMGAAANGSRERVMGFLLESGFDPDLRNKNGETALHLVAKSGGVKELVELLVRFGAHADVKCAGGQRADRLLAERGVVYLVPRLQCLAARVVVDHRIPFGNGKIPSRYFDDFINLH